MNSIESGLTVIGATRTEVQMNKDTGGPAFPIPGLQHDEAFNGMTLRDYFAGQAMQGFAASEAEWSDGLYGMAKCAYKWADAMLEARK